MVDLFFIDSKKDPELEDLDLPKHTAVTLGSADALVSRLPPVSELHTLGTVDSTARCTVLCVELRGPRRAGQNKNRVVRCLSPRHWCADPPPLRMCRCLCPSCMRAYSARKVLFMSSVARLLRVMRG